MIMLKEPVCNYSKQNRQNERKVSPLLKMDIDKLGFTHKYQG